MDGYKCTNQFWLKSGALRYKYLKIYKEGIHFKYTDTKWERKKLRSNYLRTFFLTCSRRIVLKFKSKMLSRLFFEVMRFRNSDESYVDFILEELFTLVLKSLKKYFSWVTFQAADCLFYIYQACSGFTFG